MVHTLDTTANGTGHLPLPPDPLGYLPPLDKIDYRAVLPRTAEDVKDIQTALEMTRAYYRIYLRMGNEIPPTSIGQTYLFQLNELVSMFRAHWRSRFGITVPAPELVRCWGPWRDGFKSSEIPAIVPPHSNPPFVQNGFMYKMPDVGDVHDNGYDSMMF